jgi:hypothetical protein
MVTSPFGGAVSGDELIVKEEGSVAAT